MTKSTISPFVVGEAEKVQLADANGVKKTYWRKEILPSGTRKYGEETLDFSVINPACVKAFESGAVGDVPFVFALSDNSHPRPGSEEEQNLGGDLYKLELAADGSLFGVFDLSERALKAVENSKGKFGVSGRIEPDYLRKDTGEKFPFALTHVCGTTRPYVKGLKPWEAVTLSEETAKQEVVDLSTEVVEESPTVSEGGKVNVEIDKDVLETLLAMAKDHKEATAAIQALDNKDTKPEEVKLSDADQARIELAEKRAKEGFELAEKMQIQLAESNWKGRRAELAREGVPPVVLTAAEKVLKFHKRPTIELSDGTKVDAAGVIEEILEACKGVVNLSDEEGHGFSDKGGDVDKEFVEFEKGFLADMGYVFDDAQNGTK
jgi:hypothetical protein